MLARTRMKGFIASAGFTLVELLVSIGILVIIFAIVSINISPIPSNTLQNASLDTLVSDIRSQQTLAMTTGSPHGIHFESGNYTLFSGATYTQGSVGNFVINLDSGIVLTNLTFPNSTVVFLAGSGDISGYIPNQDSFTLGSTVTNKFTLVKINKYGANY